ncbi:MAG: hypothetical protein RLZZ150_217 [Bacteroidota bacterium]|jgi:hypothetical protein
MIARRHSTKCWLAISSIAMSWFLIGCGATQPIRVLPAQTAAVTASLGGPVVPGKSPTVITPYITGGVLYGASDNVTLHGNLHLLMTAFKVMGIDVGASTRILRGEGWTPEITGGIRAYGFVQLSDQPKPRLYPSISANASWTIRERDLIYVGSHLTAQFSPNETFVSPFIGYSVAASDNLSLQLECIWQASNHDTRSGVLEGISSIGGQGSFGIFIAGVIRL